MIKLSIMLKCNFFINVRYNNDCTSGNHCDICDIII